MTLRRGERKTEQSHVGYKHHGRVTKAGKHRVTRPPFNPSREDLSNDDRSTVFLG
jgi:hypothetical protein